MSEQFVALFNYGDTINSYEDLIKLLEEFYKRKYDFCQNLITSSFNFKVNDKEFNELNIKFSNICEDLRFTQYNFNQGGGIKNKKGKKSRGKKSRRKKSRRKKSRRKKSRRLTKRRK